MPLDTIVRAALISKRVQANLRNRPAAEATSSSKPIDFSQPKDSGLRTENDRLKAENKRLRDGKPKKLKGGDKGAGKRGGKKEAKGDKDPSLRPHMPRDLIGLNPIVNDKAA